MPRLQLRLSTVTLLVLIIALAAALFVQRRRELLLNARVQVLEAEVARNQRISFRMQALMQEQRVEAMAQVARLSGYLENARQNRPMDQGGNVK